MQFCFNYPKQAIFKNIIRFFWAHSKLAIKPYQSKYFYVTESFENRLVHIFFLAIHVLRNYLTKTLGKIIHLLHKIIGLQC